MNRIKLIFGLLFLTLIVMAGWHWLRRSVSSEPAGAAAEAADIGRNSASEKVPASAITPPVGSAATGSPDVVQQVANSAVSAKIAPTTTDANRVPLRSVSLDLNSATTLTLLNEGDEVTLPGFDGAVLKGRINHRQVESSGQVIIGGHLISGQKGTFSFSLSHAGFNGSVLLPDKAVAYVISQSSVAGVPRLTLSQKPIAEVVCSPFPAFPKELPSHQTDSPSGSGGGSGPAVVPILSSRPSATAVLYLDFDGETVTDPHWNGGRTIEAKASTLKSDEMTEVWRRVSEDYVGFDVDITTDILRYNNAPVGRRMRCIVTPTNTAWPGSGGVAYLNSFAEAGSTFSETIPCWVFNPGVIGVSEAVSHEFGHTLGLRHDGRSSPQEEYFQGHGEGDLGWAPIMGVGYYKKVVQWSRGEYVSANNHEDDLATIASPINGFGYSADEAGGSIDAAEPFLAGTIGQVVLDGVVQNGADTDVHQFTAPSGLVRIEGSPAASSPNLDMLLELRDATGNVLATSNPDGALTASLSHLLSAAGTYYLGVRGTGHGDPLTDGYSNYGSTGAYALRGTIPVGDGIPFIEAGTTVSLPRYIAANHQIPAANSPTIYSATGLPAGIVLNATTGVITGIPTAAAGSYTVTVTLTNALGSRSGTFILTLTPEPAPTITTTAVVLVRQGKPLSLGIAATALPHSYTATGLPADLSMNVATGVITGTPTATGFFSVTVSATNATGTGTAQFTLAVMPQFPAVATGLDHSLFVRDDGTLWATGANVYGQLGDGTSTAKNVPIQVATGVTSAAAGANFSLFLKADGTLWAMGMNSSGQLGDGTTTFRPSPVQVATGVASIAAGHNHGLFLKADGTLWAMGMNGSGQLGDGTNISRYTPVQVATDVAAIACGSDHSLYIKADGTLWAMGSNMLGQLGDGTMTDRKTSVQVATNVFSVTGSSGGTLFVKNDATLWGMGFNPNRHLGGSNSYQLVPVKVADEVVASGAGYQSSHFLKADGSLWMTGYDGLNSYPTPVQVAGEVSSFAIDSDNLLLYKSTDGRFWGRGQNRSARLGDGTYVERTLPVLIATGVWSMDAGYFHSLFVTNDQSLWVMGINSSGQLGDGGRLERGTPFQVATGVLQVAGGYNHSLFIKNDGSLWGMGARQEGQLKGIAFDVQSPPALVETGVVTAVAAGNSFSLYLKADGTLSAMGSNTYGQIGNGTPSSNAAGVVSDGVVAIAAEGDCALFLKTDGTLWATGRNGYGQLGDGTTIDRATPVLVASGVSKVAAGWEHSLFLKTDGSLWAMGSNGEGQLGDGSTTLRTSPVMIAGSVTAMAAGHRRSYFIKTDGTLWAMGNKYGATPVRIARGVTKVVANGNHALYLKVDGTLWGLGDNGFGQLGDGAMPFTETPVEIKLGRPGIATQTTPFEVDLGGSVTFSVTTTGAIPLVLQWRKDGVAISGATGASYTVNGAQASDGGIYDVVVTNGVGSVISSAGALTVMGAPPQFTSPSAVSAPRLVPLTFQVTAANDASSFGATGLPAGLVIEASSGLIAGIPTAGPGSYPVALTATNAHGSTFATLTLTLTNEPAPVITSGATFIGRRGVSLAYGIAATPQPVSYGATGLPAGLSVNPATGAITGTPTDSPGVYPVTLSATNATGTGNLTLRLAILTEAQDRVAGSVYDSFFLEDDGTLWAAGDNYYGQLGDNSTVNRSTAVQIASGVVSVSSGITDTLFIKKDGTVWGMGLNINGGLAQGHTRMQTQPVLIATDTIAVSAGFGHNLFLKADGGLWAVGQNYSGELGDGTTLLRYQPVLVATGVAQLAANGNHSLFVKIDGTLWGMGYNGAGQLGDGTLETRLSPIQISTGVKAVAAASLGSLFLKTDGTLWGMGFNGANQMKTRTDEDDFYQRDPVLISPDVTAFAAGPNQNLYIRTDGTLWGRGSNAFGQLGDREKQHETESRQLATNVAACASGQYHSIYRKTDGTWWSLGSSSAGELADGWDTEQPVPQWIRSDVKQTVAGADHSLFVTREGRLWAMGYNGVASLGDRTKVDRLVPVPIIDHVDRAASNFWHNLVIKTDGNLWGMGNNQDGQLGNGATGFVETPLRVDGDVRRAATGGWHSLYVKTDGTAWTMGANVDGQLGDGTNVQKTLPVQMMTGVTEVAAGYRHSLFLKSDGSLWACGLNEQGQLGDGTTTTRQVPVQVATGVTKIAASGWHSLFLKADGSLWAMGYNGFGQLGDGSNQNQSLPILVDLNVRDMAAGFYHTQFVKQDGTVWAMGLNTIGQLGHGMATTRIDDRAIQAGSAEDGLSISANPSGGTGRASVRATVRPTSLDGESVLVAPSVRAIGAALRLTAVPASRTQAAAHAGSGDAVALNSVELLGYGEPASVHRPVQIATGVTGVSGGGYHSLYVRHNGTLWAMGSALLGRLGNGVGEVAWEPHEVRLGLPAILHQSIPFSARLNQRVEMSVRTSGKGMLTYQWRKNGQPIAGSTADYHLLPSVVAADGGVYDVVVTNSMGSRTCTAVNLSVVDAVPAFAGALAASTPRMADGFTFRIEANNDATSFSATGLPGGLTLDTTTGIISGRVDAAEGLYPITITATNATGSSTTTLNLTVTAQAGPVITSAGTILSRRSQIFRYVVTGQNSPQTFTATDLPTGLAIDPATGVISGRISAPAGRYTATVSATNVAGSGSGILEIIVFPESAGLAAAIDHSLVVDADGVLWSMGNNGAGKLGDGTTVERGAPVRIATDVVAASAGYNHSLFLTSDGRLWGMGDGSFLGTETTSMFLTPVQIASRVQGFVAGHFHTLLVDWDGIVWATGSNYYGQLGDGTTVNRNSLVQVATGVEAVAAGFRHSLFLKSDGSLWATGGNNEGQLGDGTNIDRLNHVQIATGVWSVTAAYQHTAYVKNDGTLWTVGDNWAGKLGDGTTTSRSTPVNVASGVVLARSGGSGTFYLTAGGDLWAMGENSAGKMLESGGPWPTKIKSDVAGVALGDNHSLFVDTQGRILAAGFDGSGQLGDAPVSYRALPQKLATDVARVSPGDYHTMFIRDDQTLWGMGQYYGAQRGAGINSGLHSLDILAAPGVSPATEVASATRRTLFIDAGRQLWGMGDNSDGEIGGAAIGQVSSPWPIASEVVAVAAGPRHSLYVKSDGSLWASGSNLSGELGDGTATNRQNPVKVAENVVKVAAGGSHSLFLKADGSLWGMGSNWTYAINPSGVSAILTPVQIATEVATMSAGALDSFFVKTDGTLWGMGYNNAGQLGDGTEASRANPVQIATGVSAVSASDSAHTVFLKTDGTAWAMGANHAGQLGDGTTTDRLSPVLVATGVASIAAGPDRTFFLKQDHTLWGTGSNAYGRLGLSIGLERRVPVQIPFGIPVINSMAIPVGANLGGTAFLSVTATGSGTLTYQWRRNGLPIAGATGSGHHIGVVAAGDGGVYDVVVTNAVGSTVSAAGSMAVLNAMPVISSPLSASANAGTAFSYRIVANNDAATFSASGLPVGLTMHTATGLITGVLAGSAGHYPVVLRATNQHGSTEAILDLEVFDAPVITQQPTNKSVPSGGSATFAVSASGTPAPVLKWQVSNNGGSTWSDLANSSLYSGVTSSELTITGATTVMNGYLYRVVATNVAGSAHSNAATLTVSAITSPEIDVRWNSLSIATGDTSPSADDGTDYGVRFTSATSHVVKTFTILNAGSAVLQLNGSSLVSISGSNAFGVWNQPTSSAISPGGSVTFTLVFTPLSAGAHVATVHIANNDNDENLYTFSVGGIALPPAITLEPNPISFGDVAVGDTSTKLVSLTNNSSLAFNVNSYHFAQALGFAGGGPLGAIAPGQTIQVLVAFTPTEVRDYSGTITISSDAGPAAISVSGRGVSALALPGDTPVTGGPDFNGDGRGDILWSHSGNGERALWMMDGTKVAVGAVIGTVPVEWEISAKGDFNADGKSDLFWTNTTTGDRAAWLMDESKMMANAYLGLVPVAWVVSGTGDFNGDGKDDILWTNTSTGDRAMWFMNGGAYAGGGYLTMVPLQWRVGGTGDYNGDGKADILWSNANTGERAMWLMDGTVLASGAVIGTVPVEWSISASGDYNGDGKADILWTNTVTGDRAMWLMNGAQMATNAYLSQVPVQWRVSGAGDYNGDGKADVLWTNTVTGDRAMWFMEGDSVLGGGYLSNVPLEWHVVP